MRRSQWRNGASVKICLSRGWRDFRSVEKERGHRDLVQGCSRGVDRHVSWNDRRPRALSGGKAVVLPALGS
jgi:hypothetical protein